MRELTVFYCPKCGRYGYYQMARNATCAECNIKMVQLPLPYKDFVRLDRNGRDLIISEEILKSSPFISSRIRAADRSYHERHQVAKLHIRIAELEAENKKLNDTIDWMHETIWDLLSKSKSLERQLAELELRK